MDEWAHTLAMCAMTGAARWALFPKADVPIQRLLPVRHLPANAHASLSCPSFHDPCTTSRASLSGQLDNLHSTGPNTPSSLAASETHLVKKTSGRSSPTSYPLLPAMVDPVRHRRNSNPILMSNPPCACLTTTVLAHCKTKCGRAGAASENHAKLNPLKSEHALCKQHLGSGA